MGTKSNFFVITIFMGFLQNLVHQLTNIKRYKILFNEKKAKISLILLCSPHVSDDIVVHILGMYHPKCTQINSGNVRTLKAFMNHL